MIKQSPVQSMVFQEAQESYCVFIFSTLQMLT